MSPEEMEATINTMKRKTLQQEDLLRKAGKERNELEQDLEEVCEDMEMDRGTRRRGGGTRKNGGKSSKDSVDVQMVKIVADVLMDIFCLYKFTRKSQLLRYSDNEDVSFCARIRAAFRRSDIRFNRLVWKNVCEMGITWMVKHT